MFGLRSKLHPRQWLPSLIAGLVTGMSAITVSVAFAALLFSGDLAGYVSAGIGLMLFGSCVVGLVSALTSSIPGLVAGLQDSAVAILALVSAAIARALTPAAGPEAFITAVAAISLTTLLAGAVFLLLGLFNLGNLIRFIPYPVIGGFLAGMGLLLVMGAASVMTNAPVSLMHLSPLAQPNLLVKWLPGLLFAVLLWAILRRSSHFLIVPGMLLAAIAVFYGLLALTRTSIPVATAQGWLLSAFPAGGSSLWPPLSRVDLGQVNWSVLGGQIGSLVVAALISVIAILLNITGIELAIGQDIDLNRELKAAGVSNLIAGLGGSSVGYHVLGDTVLVHKMGAKSRLTGVCMAAVCGAALFAGGSLLSYFPTPILGGLLLFLGLDFLVTWVYEAWFRLPKADYLIMILILLVINSVGFLEGVGLGVVLAVALFVVNYSRVGVVRHTLSGTTYQSNVDRPRLYHQLLRQKGHWLYILELQGFIFFGTANALLEQVRRRLDEPAMSPPHFVVLDFRLVSGLDSSAALSFVKMKQLAQARKIVLVFTCLPPRIRHQLDKELFKEGEGEAWRIFPDLDHGIEWCEDQMIETFESVGFGARPSTLVQQLEKGLPPAGVADLFQYLERQEVEPGHYLIRQGDEPRGLYFIETGQMTVQLEREGGPSARLRTMGPGTVAGEQGLYLKRKATASVIADRPSTLYYLSADNLKRMEETSPATAAAFHKFIAGLLGERLASMNDTLQALLG